MNSNESSDPRLADPDVMAAIARLEHGGFSVAVVARCPAEDCGWCPASDLAHAA